MLASPQEQSLLTNSHPSAAPNSHLPVAGPFEQRRCHRLQLPDDQTYRKSCCARRTNFTLRSPLPLQHPKIRAPGNEHSRNLADSGPGRKLSNFEGLRRAARDRVRILDNGSRLRDGVRCCDPIPVVLAIVAEKGEDERGDFVGMKEEEEEDDEELQIVGKDGVVGLVTPRTSRGAAVDGVGMVFLVLVLVVVARVVLVQMSKKAISAARPGTSVVVVQGTGSRLYMPYSWTLLRPA